MADTGVPRVVVGVDGSESGDAALRYALHEAGRRGARLVVVSVWETRDDGAGLGAGHERLAREHVGLVAGESVPGKIPIEVHARSGAPADVLIEAARDAALLVLGHGGHGGVPGLHLGPVVLRCVLHAPCAVLVVPRDAPPDSPEVPGGNVLPITRHRRPSDDG